MATTTPPPGDRPGDRPPPGATASGTGGAPAEAPLVDAAAKPVNRGWYVLLLAPFVAMLWPPFYARKTPELLGMPFFYWYHFLWVLITVVITTFVYAVTTPRAGRELAAGHEVSREELEREARRNR